jgi:hypothetical protein
MHRALFCAVFMSLMAIGNSTTCISHIGPINSDGVTCQDFSLGNGEHEVCYEFGMCGICCDQCADAPNCEYAMEEPEYQCPAGYEGGPCSSTSANLKTFLDTWGSYCYEYAKDYDGGVLHDYCADQGLCSICCKECAGAPGCTICNSGGPPPCAAGSTGPAGSCTLCVAGKYKDTTGSAACDDCGAGKFSAATGQSSSATCQNCVAGKFSAATGQSSSATCQNCLAGSYAVMTGSFACTQCPASSTSPAGSSAVTQCTCNAGYVKSADVCVAPCNAGYTGPGGELCTPCAEGKYKTEIGSAACQQCNPSLAYNPQYSPNAFTGPYSPAASTSISQCFCPANSHFGWGYPNCRYCPANSETLEINAADEGKCGCKAGYWGPRWKCQPCLAGTYKNYVCSAFNCEPQNTACAKCPDGTYQGADGQSTCISCGVGTETHWNGGSTGFNDATIPCKCKLPYIGNPGTGCKLCEAGTINWQDHGVNFCLSCSVIDQYRNSSAGSSKACHD